MKNAEADAFWPEYKVYLYGQVAFLCNYIENIGFRKQKIGKYFQPLDSNDILEEELSRYEKNGYFKSSTIIDGDGVKLYLLTSIDKQKFTDELTEYILSIQSLLAFDKAEKIWSSASRQVQEKGYSPKISWRDIYGDTSRYEYHPPFWEYIFTLKQDGKIGLNTIDYTPILHYLMKKDGLKDMPKEMMDLYIRPYAEITILDPLKKKYVTSSKNNANAKITLTLKGRHLWGQIGQQRYLIRKYQSLTSNNYKALESLMAQSGEFLSREKLNLKTNATTELRHLPGNMGFTGVLNNYFIDRQDSPKYALKLNKVIEVEESEIYLIKAEFEKRNKENRE